MVTSRLGSIEFTMRSFGHWLLTESRFFDIAEGTRESLAERRFKGEANRSMMVRPP